MVASLVFIFLLDHLPDHPQHSLYTNQSYEYQHAITKVQQCNTHIADRLVQHASKQLNTFLIPHWTYNDDKLVTLLGNLTKNSALLSGLDIETPNNIEENMSTIEFNHFIEDELTSQMIDDTSDCDDKFKTNDNDKLIGSTFLNEFSESDAAIVNHQGINNNSVFENNDSKNTKNNGSNFMAKTIRVSEIESIINYDDSTHINNTDKDNVGRTDDSHKHAAISIDHEYVIPSTPKNRSNFSSLESNYDISANETSNNESYFKSLNIQTTSDDEKEPLHKDYVIKPTVNIEIDAIRNIDEKAITNYNNTNTHAVVVLANDTFINSETQINKTTPESIINENEDYQTILSKNKTEQNLNSSTELTTDKELVKAFPPRVPYLVAMFESLSNVTAQTCGGTLVASQWVLTSSSCVNVLQNLLNITDVKEKTTYTVIVNATNPLLDGAAFNVTEILLHPQSPASTSNKIVKEKLPVLALLKIEPEANIEDVQIEESVKEGVDVMVYGWVLIKNESGHDEMHAASYPATTLSPLQCRVRYGLPDDSTLCLETRDSGNGSFSQMTSGGPVMMLTDHGRRLLALAVSDVRVPLLAAPLHAHAHWMRDILRARAVL